MNMTYLIQTHGACASFIITCILYVFVLVRVFIYVLQLTSDGQIRSMGSEKLLTISLCPSGWNWESIIWGATLFESNSHIKAFSLREWVVLNMTHSSVWTPSWIVTHSSVGTVGSSVWTPTNSIIIVQSKPEAWTFPVLFWYSKYVTCHTSARGREREREKEREGRQSEREVRKVRGEREREVRGRERGLERERDSEREREVRERERESQSERG